MPLAIARAYAASRVVRKPRPRRIPADAVEESCVSAPPVQSPARALLDDALGSLGKVVAAAAGAGLFLYLIGTAVLWQRVDNLGLQAQEVVAVIPRDQLAVAGAREVLLSLVAGAIFAYFLYGCYAVYRACEAVVDTGGVRGRFARWMRERPALLVTAAVAIVGTLLVPFGASDALFGLFFLGNLFLGMRSAHRSLVGELPDFRSSLKPWLRVVAGWSIAVFLVSVWRPAEFPEPFPTASVELVKPAEFDGTGCDRYVGLTSDAVILARPTSCAADEAATAVVVARAKIAQMTLKRAPTEETTHSLLWHVTGWELACVPPVCQIDGWRWNLLRPFDPERTEPQ
jgi:hypothetical protein